MDMLIVVAIIMVLAGIAMPGFIDAVDGYRLGMATRDVERELQFARLKAVSTNTAMRIRFNCPVEGQLRVVELIGTPAAPDANDADTFLDRCKESLYPYKPTGADSSRLTRPNNDGAVRYLQPNTSFAAAQTLEFWPDGSVHTPCAGACAGGGAPIATSTITLLRKTRTKNITVNGLGKITMDR
jgi:hypothetical protein